jgi:hypothetical protein
MPSRWGRKTNRRRYDSFRTGLTYAEVYAMMSTSDRHRYRRRGSVLGFWHEIKLQLYEQALDRGYEEEAAP